MKKKTRATLSVVKGGKGNASGTRQADGPDAGRIAAVAGEAASLLASLQQADGHWVFDLEADVTIPSEYIMLQRFLGRKLEESMAARLSAYFLLRQLPDGGWPLYAMDGSANISASVKAYFALKLLGHDKDAPHMVRARQMILALGGAAKANVFTRITLALFGQIPWHTPPAMPVEIMLLPKWFFFHLSKVSYWSRTVIVPLLILYAKRPVCRLGYDEGIAELFTSPPDTLVHLDGFRACAWRKNLFILLDRLLKITIPFIPNSVRDQAQREAERWTRARMQGDGGIGAIYPAMANAVMALKVLGCADNDPDYQRGLKAVENLMVHARSEAGAWPEAEGQPLFPVLNSSSAVPKPAPQTGALGARTPEFNFCQPCNSPVWDTCLSLTALCEAWPDGPEHLAARATDWLFSQQISVRGDWAGKRPDLECGGWAFQYENALYPDVDDTAKVLMSLFRAGALGRPECQDRITRAVQWVLGMQSSDGGWGAFDVDNNHPHLNDIPFADHGALLDPSTADLTGRCIEMLGMLGYGPSFPPVARGIAFLKRGQEPFGGWFGRWGVNYIYGTWSVLSGLCVAGEDMSVPYVRNAVNWIVSCQNEDGGWGESCASYDDPSLAGSGASTASQTAWALLALMAAGEFEHGAVRAGVEYLAETFDEGWQEGHFTGTGFPRVFYLRYHGYSLFFPVWALGVYRRMRGGIPTAQEQARTEHLKTGNRIHLRDDSFQ